MSTLKETLEAARRRRQGEASRILNRTRHPFKNPQQKKESELAAVGCIMAQLGSWPLLAAFSYCFSVNFLVVVLVARELVLDSDSVTVTSLTTSQSRDSRQTLGTDCCN